MPTGRGKLIVLGVGMLICDLGATLATWEDDLTTTMAGACFDVCAVSGLAKQSSKPEWPISSGALLCVLLRSYRCRDQPSLTSMHIALRS
eukprot:4474433-Pyramimonas_sp.AAC.1